jgi:hypothetical protein
MAEPADWSRYHQADEQFHQLVGTASGLGNAVEAWTYCTARCSWA